MLLKLHFIFVLFSTLLFIQVVSAFFGQKVGSIRNQYPRIHPYEPTNQDVNQQSNLTNNNIADTTPATIQVLEHQPVEQQLSSMNKSIQDLPEDILQLISDNLDSKSIVELGATSVLFKNITLERNAEIKQNLRILKNACGNSVYWSLTQNGHSIFQSQDVDRWRSIEEHESCIRAIILNYPLVKNGLKHLTIANPSVFVNNDKILSYLDSLGILFNIIDHLESITISFHTSNSFNPEHELRLFRILSSLNVDSVAFNRNVVVSTNAFSQFTQNSTLRFLTIFGMNHNQVSYLQNLRNLESLTLNGFQENFIDFSSLPHLRHISMESNYMYVDEIFSGTNSITSIHSAHFRNQNLELSLGNTTKQITSLTFSNGLRMKRQERILSYNLFTKFISSLKHTTIVLELDMNEVFDRFLKDSTLLESIIVHRKFPSNSLGFLDYAHGIKYFEFHDYFLTENVNPNLIQFIERQTNLQSFTFMTSYLHSEDQNIYLQYLDKIVDAILVRKTVKELNLNVKIEITSKIEFTQSFYECLSKLENLDLTLNGVPIKKVLRDLRVFDDSVFYFFGQALTLKLNAREKPSIY